MNNKKNVIYILIDSLRADRMNLYGFQHTHTPFLNKVANESMLCKKAYTAGNPTEFALPSIMASSYLLDNGGFADGISNREKTLAEVFAENGYDTVGIFSCYERSSSQYGRGFKKEFHLYDINRFCKDIENAIPFYQRSFKAGDMSLSECLKDLTPLIATWLKDSIDHCNHPPIPLTDSHIPRSMIFEIYNYQSIKKDVEAEYNLFKSNEKEYVKNIICGSRFNLLNIIYDYFAERTKKSKPSFFEIIYRILLASNMYRSWFSSNTYKSSKEVIALSLERCLKGLKTYIKFPSGRFYFETFKNWNKSQPAPLRKPYFAFLHIQDLHELNHISYDMYGLENKKKQEIKTYRKAMKKIAKGKKNYKGNTMYDAAISYVDLLMEDLYSHLKEEEQLENTIIIFTSDHGHKYPDLPVRENISHPDDFFDELYHVPLFFWDYNRSAEEVPDLTSSIDIAPTILDFLGMKIPPAFRGFPINNVFKRDYVMMENQGRGPCSLDKKYVHVCVRSNKYKVIYSSLKNLNEKTHVRAVFNLENDPQEYINLKDDKETLELTKDLLVIAKNRINEIFQKI